MENIEGFAEILDKLGASGKYQKLLLYGVVVPIAIIVPIMNLSPIFILNIPNHWCKVPIADQESMHWKNTTLPVEIGPDGVERFSQCKMYDSNQTIIECPNGWDYDRSNFDETLPSDLNWVCSKSHYPTTLFTFMQVGNVCGAVVFGLMADRVGRKPIFFICLSIYLTLRLTSYLIPHYFVPMVIVTFLSSLGYPMVNNMPVLILSEVCDDGLRSWAYSLFWMVYVVGGCAAPYVAFLYGHWFHIVLGVTLPSYIIFIAWFFIPESPRWLTSVGRTKDATAILRKIAKVNGTLDKCSEVELLKTLAEISEAQKKVDLKKPTVLTLFKKRVLAKHMILIIISWAFSDLVYEVITLNTPNMSGDLFLNFCLLTLIDAPSSVIAGFLLKRVGRRWTASLFYIICSISCFVGAVFVMVPNLKIISVSATYIAKFAINASYLVVYLQAAELLPTLLRATGNSVGATTSSFLGIIGPSVVFTANYYAATPYLIMGAITAVATVSSTFLPETLHEDLPETVEAANEFGIKIPYWSYQPGRRKPKTTPTTDEPMQMTRGRSEGYDSGFATED